jgi:outer membrane protein OmpA-like peptidoglycan-associated protein
MASARVGGGGWLKIFLRFGHPNTASSGSVSGNGSTATLDSSSAAAGLVTVSATRSDARGLNTPATAQVVVENPPTVSPEVRRLESRLALHSIYFPTAKPTLQNPEARTAGQQQTLFLCPPISRNIWSSSRTHLILGTHADPRGSVEYNQALSERRVERARQFLIDHGVPAANIETKAFGKEQNLTDAQVRDAVEQNPELTPEERQRILKNMRTIILASNRRVDVTLSTTGQQSVRQYPFNAAHSLTLLEQQRADSTNKAHRQEKGNGAAIKAERKYKLTKGRPSPPICRPFFVCRRVPQRNILPGARPQSKERF